MVNAWYDVPWIISQVISVLMVQAVFLFEHRQTKNLQLQLATLPMPQLSPAWVTKTKRSSYELYMANLFIIKQLTGVQSGSWGVHSTSRWTANAPRCVTHAAASWPNHHEYHSQLASASGSSELPTQTSGSPGTWIARQISVAATKFLLIVSK